MLPFMTAVCNNTLCPSLQVVLAVALCTRPGKLVMSRQFVEMTRIRIEGLMAAFPKLLGGAGKQHTFVETDNVRFPSTPT